MDQPQVSPQRSSMGQSMVVAAAVIIVIAGVKWAADLIVPFLLSLFIALVTMPLYVGLIRRKAPPILALTIVLIVVLVVGLLCVAVLGISGNQFASKIPEYQQQLNVKIQHVEDLIARLGLEDVLDEPVLDGQPAATGEATTGDAVTGDAATTAPTPDTDPAPPSPLPTDPTLAGQPAPPPAQDASLLDRYFSPNAIMRYVGIALGALGNLLNQAALIFLIVVFILLEATILPEKLRNRLELSPQNWSRFEAMIEAVRQYTVIKTWISLLTGVLVGIWLWIMGIDFIVLFALIAFVLNYIPTIGSIIAAVPAVLLAIVTQDIGSALLLAVGYVVINTVVGNIIEPRVMGKGFGLSALFILLAMVFFGWLLGPIGMFLSVPLLIVVKIAMEVDPKTRWLAVLIGSETRKPEPDQP